MSMIWIKNVIQIIHDIRVALGLNENNGTFSKKSTIENAGMGLFATQNFKKNDFIDFYTGDIIFQKEKLSEQNKYLFFNEKEGFFIDGKNGNSMRLINHHKQNSNCAFEYYELPDIRILYPIVVCVKDIKIGDELLCDYGSYYDI